MSPKLLLICIAACLLIFCCTAVRAADEEKEPETAGTPAATAAEEEKRPEAAGAAEALAAAEEKKPRTVGATPAAAQGPSEAEMMAAMMKAATPGEPHSRMKSMAGSWTMSVKSFFGPGEPQVSEGTCEAATILGDRYIKEECRGDFGGMPFQGMGIYGYDNLKKKYVSAWVDNMGTGIMLSQGTWDAKKKTFTYRSTQMDPLTLKNEPVKMVIKVDSEDSHTASFYGWKNGKDVLQMEITYTRK